ncbi:hypothetical protein AGMMS49975_17410 [Clostridia bacterium]|nr:hypothetical protein AGMMS49975_17410 [Clostridia bacterium]
MYWNDIFEEDDDAKKKAFFDKEVKDLKRYSTKLDELLGQLSEQPMPITNEIEAELAFCDFVSCYTINAFDTFHTALFHGLAALSPDFSPDRLHSSAEFCEKLVYAHLPEYMEYPYYRNNLCLLGNIARWIAVRELAVSEERGVSGLTVKPI